MSHPHHIGLRARAAHTPEAIADALGRPRPTAEQSAVISADMTPLLVVAGAGSGKTATMVDRVVWLVVNGFVRPEEILGVTFTKKAAGELRQRMTARLRTLEQAGRHGVRPDADPGPGTGAGQEDAVPSLEPVVSTYHSYAKSLVSEYGLRIGIERDVTQLGPAQAAQLATQIVQNWDGEMPENRPAASTLVQALLQLSGECAEHLRTPEQVVAECEQWAQRLRRLPHDDPKQRKTVEEPRAKVLASLEKKILVARLAARYQRVKEAMQVMDYGDLLAYAATMAGNLEAVGSEQRELYKVVLLDEFQDTSHAQMALFAHLFGAGHSVMAVGDPKQSIYGFRGASEGQLFDFYDYFPSEEDPSPEPAFLSVAWRNSQSVLDAANRVAAPLSVPDDWARASSTLAVLDLQPRPEVPEGRVEHGVWETSEAEAAAVVERILASRRSRPPEQLPATAAVLARSRATLERVRVECERRGVPYELLGLGGLLDTPEVVDLVATLRVLADPERSDALLRLLAGARWRLGLGDLMALNDWARFLAARQKAAVRRGAAADLSSPDGTQATDPQHPGRLSPQEAVEEFGREASEASSLVEALENLPVEGWTSSAGRCLSATGRNRLGRLAEELAELRGYLGEDLSVLVHHIERLTLLDLELASVPGRDVHQARANLDAFGQTVADYCATAPRMAASLDVGAAVGIDPDQPLREGRENLRIPERREHRYTVTSSAVGVMAFLAWLDTALEEENGLKVPAEQGHPEAVQLLTMHGSKGLEWDEVYLCGMAEGVFPTSQREHWFNALGALPWPLRGDRDHLPQLGLDATGTVELHENWGTFVQANEERVVAEERRLAYVGLTRARDLLVLTAAWWTGPNKKPRALSRFLEELLAPGPGASPQLLHRAAQPETGTDTNPSGEEVHATLWPADPLASPVVGTWPSVAELDAASAGGAVPAALEQSPALSRRAALEQAAALVRQAQERIPDPQPGPDQESGADHEPGADPSAAGELAEEWAEEVQLLLALRARRRRQAQELVPPAHVSPSLLVGLSEDPQAVLQSFRRPMPRRPGAQAHAGTLFHGWVEEHYGNPAMLDLEEPLSGTEDFTDETSEQDIPGGPAMQQLQQAFRESPWFHRQPWAVEFPIETPLGRTILRGRVDAVFHRPAQDGQPEQWELVDWKTGRIPTGQDMEHKAVQLAAYRLGFARLMEVPVQQVRACFHYVGQNRTVEPEALASEQELTALLEAFGDG